jgi:hydrogenase small subunit
MDGRRDGRTAAPCARPSVVYLSFQECTGCFESLTRSFAPTIESLIFNVISLDYDDTLMAAPARRGTALDAAMKAISASTCWSWTARCRPEPAAPTAPPAAAAPSTPCARRPRAQPPSFASAPARLFGGIPFADPNPTGAWPVSAIVGDKPIINVSGCPPIPEVITGTLLQFVSTGEGPGSGRTSAPKGLLRQHHSRPLLSAAIL